jgi:hypothetical protein
MARRFLIVLLSVPLLALASLGCDSGPDGDVLPSPTPTSGEVTADIYDGDHPDLNVYVGARIRWRNLGDIAHTVTAKDGSFDTGPIEEGQRSGYILFSKAGTIEYYDTLNPGMVGRIQVFEK